MSELVVYHGSPYRGDILDYHEPTMFVALWRDMAERYCTLLLGAGRRPARQVVTHPTLYTLSLRAEPDEILDTRRPDHRALYENVRRTYNAANPDDFLPRDLIRVYRPAGEFPGFGSVRPLRTLLLPLGFVAAYIGEGSEGASLAVFDRSRLSLISAENCGSTRFNPSLRGELEALRPQMAAAADQVVQAWTQDESGYDEEFGAGGACDEVARALGDVIASAISDVEIAEGGQEGDDHSFLFVWRGHEGYGVDIPPSVYESGGGYVWRKKAGVTIGPQDIAIWPESVKDIVGDY